MRFPAGSLRGDVTASPYIVAKSDIAGYRCRLINPEFGAGPFSFPKGSVLAVDTPSKIYIDREVFKPASSLFELVHNPALTGTQWQIRADQDRVQIVLNPKLKEKLDRFRNEKKNKVILLNSIYFAAVMECVARLREESDEGDGAEKWKRIMRNRCENLGINLNSDSLHSITQKLLNDPFRRFDAYLLNEEI